MSEIPEKHFFKIGEVCQYTDTQPYVLRFWESEFPQLAPDKNRSGQRMYTRDDIDLVFKIKALLYDQEFTIAGARKQLDDETPRRKRSAPRDRQKRLDGVSEERSGATSKKGGTKKARKRKVDTERHAAEQDHAEALRQLDEIHTRLAEIDKAKTEAEEALARIRHDRENDRRRRHQVATKLESMLETLDALVPNDND